MKKRKGFFSFLCSNEIMIPFVCLANDRARSPASQRGPSPARTSPPTQAQQQQPQPTIPDEPELKMAKDSDGPIPMPAPASASSPSTTDQQVPINDTSANIGGGAATTTATASTPPASEPVRDPNAIALEKLEQIKQSLAELEQQVDNFNGTTRNERQYKILDEQALKIMIRCDELVDVSADIKEKRKEIIRNVQRVIGKLESRVPATPAAEQNSNPMEISANTNETTNTIDPLANDINEKTASPPKETALPATATEQSA